MCDEVLWMFERFGCLHPHKPSVINQSMRDVHRHFIFNRTHLEAGFCIIKPAWAIAVEIDCLLTYESAGLAVM